MTHPALLALLRIIPGPIDGLTGDLEHDAPLVAEAVSRFVVAIMRQRESLEAELRDWQDATGTWLAELTELRNKGKLG